MDKRYLVILLCFVTPVPAPVPRCSPLIIINKLVEFASIWSDNNPYFPVPPCEYGGPIAAIQAGDFNSVFLLDEPEKIPLHNIYEFVWLLKTGIPRMKRMMLGLEPVVYDFNILKEGYQHYTPYVRTTQLGYGRKRRPELIDNKGLWKKFVGGKFRDLLKNGPDLQPTPYTPIGPIRRRVHSGPHSSRKELINDATNRQPRVSLLSPHSRIRNKQKQNGQINWSQKIHGPGVVKDPNMFYPVK